MLQSPESFRRRRLRPICPRLHPGKPFDVEVISYEGKTIYQEPPIHHLLRNHDDSTGLVSHWLDGPYVYGLQIGEPRIVAEACETAVVNQFRPMDHAPGGTGAPLMQNLDYVAFRNIARTGKVDEKLMAHFKSHEFFNRPIPRSAWRLDFGSTYADQFIAEFKNPR